MLTVNQQKINLGDLKFGQPHSFAFELTNPTPSPITVNKLVLGCHSCTKAHIESNIIKPGESTKVQVIFTPGSTGIQSKHIDVFYADQSLSLKFTANVSK
jgi:hypothetical protein